MSEFENQFNPEGRLSKLMPNEDFDRLAFLNVRIDDIEGVITLRDDENNSLEISQAILNGKIAELRRQVDLLLNERRPIDAALSRNTQINRTDFRNKEAYERERLRLLAELASRERYFTQQKLLDERTKDFPWRVGVDGKKALPHQLDGAHRLVAAERGILGDKPGLGKTLEMIMTIDLLRAQGKANKVLIFTPKSVLPDFERAFKQWTNPTFVHVLNQTLKGIKVELLEVIKHMPEAVIITNYEVWRKDNSIHEKLKDCGFDAIFCDEGHVLKGSKSMTTQKIRELVFAENKCPQCGHQSFSKRGFDTICSACEFRAEEFGDFCSCKNFYVATGTPILNKPAEIWPPLNMIDREMFPSEKNFLDDYCTKEYDYATGKHVYTFGSGGSDRLLKKLDMKYTARTRESAGVEMPPQEIKHHWLELDPEQYPRQTKFITELRDKAKLAFSETEQITTQAVLAWYTRMRQAASWPDGIQIKGCWHDPECVDDEGLPGPCVSPRVIFPPEGTPPIGESIMMDAAQDITFEAVEDGDRIVVFSMFKSVIAELERRCKEAGLRVAKITGDVPDHLRRTYIDDFNTNHTEVGKHQYDVLICQYQTAQVGLNLNGAQQLLCIEREWNPGKEEQTIDRLRRIDSKYESIVHILHCAGTATELIDAIQEQKKNMLDGFQADVDLQEAMRKFLEG
jgi:SNF2 family DNA or RNA helicase